MTRRRRWRTHARAARGSAISLVSLMDILTILVFFLLTSQTDGSSLPRHPALKLPKSIALTEPDRATSVMLTRQQIWIDGQPVAELARIANADLAAMAAVRAQLTAAFERHARAVAGAPTSAAPELSVVVLGDRQTPFHVLKRVMTLCTDVGFRHISLAVDHVSPHIVTGG